MPPHPSLKTVDLTADVPHLAIALPAGTSAPAGKLMDLDKALGGALRRTLERRDFRGGRDETLHLSGAATGPQRVLLVGLGKPADRAGALRRAGAIAARQAGRMGADSLAVHAGALDATETEALAVGLAAGAWDYTDTKTPPPAEERRAPLTSARILGADAKGLANGIAIAEGHGLARTLGMMPGNLCTPEFLAQTAREIGQRHGLTVTVQGRAEMEKLGMGSFLCVAQGTPQDPKLITLEYFGGAKGAAPVALVGKGLCFDSGGISIKPAQGMEWMKFDMCGAAGVLGAMEAIARLRLPINVVGLVGSTTNMPSGNAVKPGDVVRKGSVWRPCSRRRIGTSRRPCSTPRRSPVPVSSRSVTRPPGSWATTRTSCVRCSPRAREQGSRAGSFPCGTTTRS